MNLIELKGLAQQNVGISVNYWILCVNEDWISPDIEKHVNYLFPKVIGLMFENKRPMDEIKTVLDTYAYYVILYKMGIKNMPVLVSELSHDGKPVRPQNTNQRFKGGKMIWRN